MVPRGMASLENLVGLWIFVRILDKEGLKALMGMPSLVRLELRVKDVAKEKVTVVGSNGFKVLRCSASYVWHNLTFSKAGQHLYVVDCS